MSSIHRLAQSIILEEKAVMAPAYKNVKQIHRISFYDDLQVEKWMGEKGIRFDLYGETNKGFCLGVEILFSHKVDSNKKEKIIANGLCCIEIDVNCASDINDAKLLKDTLRDFLLDSPMDREWINNH